MLGGQNEEKGTAYVGDASNSVYVLKWLEPSFQH